MRGFSGVRLPGFSTADEQCALPVGRRFGAGWQLFAGSALRVWMLAVRGHRMNKATAFAVALLLGYGYACPGRCAIMHRPG